VRGPVSQVVDPSLLGNDRTTAALGCGDLRTNRPTAKNGVFWVDPNGNDHSDAYQVVCELETDGGGWTLAMNLDTDDGNTHYYLDTTWWTGTGSYGTAAGALTGDYKLGSAFGASGNTRIMIRVHREGIDQVGYRSWALTNTNALSTVFSAGLTRSPTAFTSSTTANDVASLNSAEAVVRPVGNLFPNMIWGAGGTPDWARIRNSAMADADNANWGLGTQMDAQNTGGMPWYPGCDAAGTTPWKTYMCIGDDNAVSLSNGDRPGSTGGAKDLQYDYAIYVR